MDLLHFEDFTPGQTMAFTAAEPVTKDAIIDFARQFDPQSFHLDEEAAKGSLLGGLAASGWHSCAMVMRLNYDGWLYRTASMGAPGIEEVKWMKPVRPGDRLHMNLRVLDKRASRSRPDMGLVGMFGEVSTQRGEVVLTQKHTQLITVRAPAPAERSDTSTTAAPASVAALPSVEGGKSFAAFYEDVEVGSSRDLGQETLTKEAILAFARLYDPQPFHMDEEAARRSHFGALAASGWHTAALWMRHVIGTRDRVVAERKAQGLETPAGGPSPGFTALRWIKPVFAGDTIRFASRVIEKRPTSRPGWGLMFSDNSGTNQHGERVFEFRGSAFVPRRA